MEIYRHNKSGKYFVFIEQIDADNVLLVNPHSRVIAIEDRSFSDEKEGSEEQFLAQGLITNEQAYKYRLHKAYREQDKRAQNQELVEEITAIFSSWTPERKAKFIEKLERSITE